MRELIHCPGCGELISESLPVSECLTCLSWVFYIFMQPFLLPLVANKRFFIEVVTGRHRPRGQPRPRLPALEMKLLCLYLSCLTKTWSRLLWMVLYISSHEWMIEWEDVVCWLLDLCARYRCVYYLFCILLGTDRRSFRGIADDPVHNYWILFFFNLMMYKVETKVLHSGISPIRKLDCSHLYISTTYIMFL